MDYETFCDIHDETIPVNGQQMYIKKCVLLLPYSPVLSTFPKEVIYESDLPNLLEWIHTYIHKEYSEHTLLSVFWKSLNDVLIPDLS
jgi:hypothetical protein